MNLPEARNWVTEISEPQGFAYSYRVKAKLHEEQSEYQLIEIYETEQYGNVMLLDKVVMLTERDHFSYHEMMVHAPIYCHPAPRDVVIVGGGDCGSLREALRHQDVRNVTQVELDQRVTAVAEKYFPELCEANDDSRAKFVFADAVHWMQQAPAASADVMILDTTDPVGQAERLFAEQFYGDCHRVLRPGGMLIVQSEAPGLDAPLIRDLMRRMVAVGLEAPQTLLFPVCCYPTGWWSAIMAGKGADCTKFRRHSSNDFATKHYTAEIHAAALLQPPWLRRLLKSQ